MNVHAHWGVALALSSASLVACSDSEVQAPSDPAAGTVQTVVAALDDNATPAHVAVLSGAHQSAPVDEAFAAELVVRVSDLADNPVAGVIVQFGGDDATTATFVAPPEPTAADGTTRVAVIAGTRAWAYDISAWVDGVDETAAFHLTNAHGPAAVIDVVSGDLQAAVVDQVFADPIVLRVADAHDNPVPAALLTLAGASDDGLLPDEVPSTDEDGVTSFNVTAGILAGGHDLVASFDADPLDPVDPIGATVHLFTLAGAPAHLIADSGAGQRATVESTFLRPIAARVTDTHGNAVHGATVVFSGADDAHVVFGAPPATTDVNGVTHLDVTAGTTAGTYQVSAALDGVDAHASWSLTNVAGAPAHLRLVSGDRQATVVNSEFAAPLVVAVSDAHDNPVPDAVVAFGGGHPERAGFFSAPEPTDEDGKTSVRVIAGTRVADYALTASVGGVPDTITFALENLAGPAARLAIVAGDHQTAMPGEALALPLVVRVSDAWDNPVAGAAVGFATPSSGATATLSDAPATDHDGRTSVTVAAGSIAGAYTITASAAGVPPVTFHQTTIVGVPARLELVGGDAQIAVVDGAFNLPLAVRVTDAHGNTLAGVPVTFASPASGAGASLSHDEVASDVDGRAEVIAHADRVAGDYVVEASVIGLAPVSFHLVNAPTPVVRLEASPESAEQSARVGTSFVNPLEVVAYDAFDNRVPSIAVRFTAPAFAPSAMLAGSVVVTDEDGSAWVDARASSGAGTYHVLASLADDARVQTSFALTNVPGPVTSVVAVSGGPAAAVAGRDFAAPLVVRVTDAAGNPVPAARVVFSRPSAEPTAQLSVSTVYTDADGLAQVGVRAGRRAGRYTVRATVEGAASPAVFDLANVAGAPSLLVVTPSGTPQSTRVGTSFDARLEVGVSDELGNAVRGVEVQWSSPSDGPGATLTAAGSTAGGAATTTSTEDDGTTSVHARASQVAGPYEVVATVDGLEPVRFALTNIAAEATTLVLWGGGSQSVAVGHPFPAPLGVALRDRFGNPIGGATIHFAVPASGASAIVPETAVTDPLGKAYVTARANDVAGIYQVTAIADGVAMPVVFGLVNKPGPAHHIVAVAETSPQSGEVGAAFAKRLGVDVQDEHGNAAMGVTVVFAAPASHPTASLSSVTAVTDASGHAEVGAIAGPVAGAYEVTASIVGLDEVAVFELENLVEPGLELGILSGAGQFAIATSGFHAPITFTVKDHLGRAVAGVPVTMVPEGDVDVPVPLAQSDADGHAIFLVTAGRTLGPVSVVAHAEGALAPVVVRLAVEGIPTDTWLESPAEAAAGERVTLTAHVDAIVGAADGVVRFYDGDRALGMRPVVDGLATLEVVPDDAGRHDFEVIFIANAPFEDSRSGAEPTEVKDNELDFAAGGGGGCTTGSGDMVLGGLLGFGLLFAIALRRRHAARSE